MPFAEWELRQEAIALRQLMGITTSAVGMGAGEEGRLIVRELQDASGE